MRYEVNSRASKDIVVNREGVKLVELCSENNLIIANGTMDAVLEGDFAFVNNQGKSVIDYLCVESSAVYSIKKFKIVELGCSDHMRLSVEIGDVKYQEREQVQSRIRNRQISDIIGWSEEHKSRCHNMLNDEVSNLLMIGINCNVEKGNMEKAVELLYFLVRRGDGDKSKEGRI